MSFIRSEVSRLASTSNEYSLDSDVIRGIMSDGSPGCNLVKLEDRTRLASGISWSGTTPLGQSLVKLSDRKSRDCSGDMSCDDAECLSWDLSRWEIPETELRVFAGLALPPSSFKPSSWAETFSAKSTFERAAGSLLELRRFFAPPPLATERQQEPFKELSLCLGRSWDFFGFPSTSDFAALKTNYLFDAARRVFRAKALVSGVSRASIITMDNVGSGSTFNTNAVGIYQKRHQNTEYCPMRGWVVAMLLPRSQTYRLLVGSNGRKFYYDNHRHGLAAKWLESVLEFVDLYEPGTLCLSHQPTESTFMASVYKSFLRLGHHNG